MRLGWKVLLPINLTWILLLAGLKVLQANNVPGATRLLVIIGLVISIVIVGLAWPAKKVKVETAEDHLAAHPTGSFPVPPLDLQIPPSPRARRGVAERQPANVGVGAPGSAVIEGDVQPPIEKED
jgi:NADH-quinone oxidoreductase subunit H